MSKKYTQLSADQRYQLEALLKAGISKKEIASILGKHKSTIYRELQKGTKKKGYDASHAINRTWIGHHYKRKHIRFHTGMKLFAVQLLEKEKYSPELVSVEGKKTFPEFVSHETIYKWIWSCKHGNQHKNRRFKKLYLTLKHGSRRRKRGRKRDMRGIIKERVPIDKRPSIVKHRSRLGDLEADLMLGKNHKSALLVILDRATLYVKLKKLKSKAAEEVEQAFYKLHKKNKHWIKTITFDNDQAFSKHQQIGKTLEASTYFTRPYTSQDKGSVENRIGVIRRFLPKKTDLNKYSNEEIAIIEKKINNRPVRKFNYQTPYQVFQKKLSRL